MSPQKSSQAAATQPGRVPPSMMSNAEVKTWIAKLEAESKSVGRRNGVLLVFLVAGALLLLAILWGLYQSGVRSYAVLEDVLLTRHPANQGRLQISFQVVSPGRVFYRRTSGNIKTEVIDYFEKPGPVQRAWSWVYEPGKEIDVSLLYRGGLWRRSQRGRFPTAQNADIVILMDTTGSMSRSINLLKEKCVVFSRQLKEQSLEHRFALIGFGDTNEERWLDQHAFTDNVEEFQKSVAGVARFDGGDLPESALDAIEAALALPFQQGAIRRFYLVTDARFHDPAKSGAKAADILARLEKEQVLLNVFSRSEYLADYAKLLGSSGKCYEMKEFGKLLTEGRILED